MYTIGRAASDLDSDKALIAVSLLCLLAGIDAQSLRLAEPLASNDFGTEMFQTGSLSNLSSLQASLNSLSPLPALNGNSARSYSSNGTHYSLSVNNYGQSYQESGALLSPSSEPNSAAPSSGPSAGILDEPAAQPGAGNEDISVVPSSGPSAGIVTASDINPLNLGSADASMMDEPADYIVPDTPNPAGQSDLVQEPTTVGEPVIINPSAGTGNADDDSSGR